ncbi:MAG TPA: asparagine synthase-related protein [Longimicrobiaceae bacterium]|nr:asparagine synthase-related protein [Longimicrobiaceae bacterium]
MSDFLFSTRRRPPGELRRHLDDYLAPVSAGFEEHHGAWGSLAVARAHHDAVVVESDAALLTVLAGDPVVRGGAEAPALAAFGPRRHAVHELLRPPGGVPWDGHLDGHFAALAVDPATGRGRVVTDLFAFVPVYAATAVSGELVLGTHVDAVARAGGRGADLDPVSAADFVASYVVTFPHTLYAGVEQLPPGTERAFSRGGWDDGGRVYWQPLEETGFGSLPAAAAALRQAVADDVRAASAGGGPVGLLLSGGEDSRAILGAMPPETEVRAFVYADWESREVRIARRVARAHGAGLTVGWRGASHYIDGLETAAALLGSQHLFSDVHGLGFHETLGIRDLPVVLGGLSSDSLLKAEYGVPLPQVPALPGVRPELLREVAARRAAFRDRLAEIRPRTADEWAVLYPFSMRRHGGNLHGNRRLFRSHEVYHATGVLRVAAGVPQEWKRRRRLFHRAMRPFLARTWQVPHAKARYPYFGHHANLLLAPGLAAARGLRAVLRGETRARQAPWPKWRSIADSPAAARRRRELPLLETPLAALFVPASPGAVESSVAHWYALHRLALLQLAFLSTRP